MTTLNHAEKFLMKAQDIMSNHLLMINKQPHQIVEVEFYLFNDDHPDTFAHCHPQQLSINQWCFHRASNKLGSKYRGGTFKGLDITFDGGEKSYTGILIRSMRNCNTQEVIEGPCCCVNKILQLCNCPSIDELVTKLDTLDIYKSELLCIISTELLTPAKILVGPRIGLKIKTEQQQQFIERWYRYTLQSAHIKKQRKKLYPVDLKLLNN